MPGSAEQAADRVAAKLPTGRYFIERMLPAAAAHLAHQAGSASTMASPAEAS
jgi:hypothetical protein